MKVKFPKIDLDEIILFLGMWVIGIIVFFGLIYLLKDKFQYKFAWDVALMISIPSGLIWTLIGTLMTKKDEKIATGLKAISAAVSHCLSNKP